MGAESILEICIPFPYTNNINYLLKVGNPFTFGFDLRANNLLLTSETTSVYTLPGGCRLINFSLGKTNSPIYSQVLRVMASHIVVIMNSPLVGLVHLQLKKQDFRDRHGYK
ncbi:hypothetical protein GDO81_020702 [Engystomops pustulosus]|uniref:Uncharacterized protein n=1 Tax=Engystomops pustulosus TaxID=76066 RepID=A0AAV6YU53_ENGPU|nr:hypothetical protein GDO81_020702 [Engystomops pustulosus]